MLRTKLISAAVATALLGAAVSTPALAGERHHGGNGAAVAAGVIGGLVLGSLIVNAASQPSVTYTQPVYSAPPQAVYYDAPTTYVQQPSTVTYVQQPAPVVYETPAPVYYGPAVRVAPAPVVLEVGGGWRHHHRHW